MRGLRLDVRRNPDGCCAETSDRCDGSVPAELVPLVRDVVCMRDHEQLFDRLPTMLSLSAKKSGNVIQIYCDDAGLSTRI